MEFYGIIKRLTSISFIRFLLVGGINTCFGYCMFALCVFLFKNVYVSVFVATVIAILFNFKTYGTFVFKSKDNSRVYRFFGVYLFTMGLQMLCLRCLALAGLKNPYIAGGVLALPLALISFILMRKFVFRVARS